MTLRRVRSFRVPGDPVVANELAQQLAKFEENVANMGEEFEKSKAARLTVNSVKDNRAGGVIVAPGQFQLFNTAAAVDITVTLQKPKPSDSGTFIALLDFAGGLGALVLRTPDSYINDSQVLLSTKYMRLIFCDGEGYWTDP